MRTALAFIIMALSNMAAIAASGHEGKANGVTVSHPWVRATPGGATLTSAYMEIKAEGADKLISAASPASGRVEVHTSILEGDVMKMRRIESLEFKAGEQRILKPSGDHIMLMDLKAPLKEGGSIKIILTFEKAGPIEVEATVEPVGASGPHGMNEQPAGAPEKSGGEHQHH